MNTDRLFDCLSDDVLDEYNNKTISHKEMKNIIVWLGKMRKIIRDKKDEYPA